MRPGYVQFFERMQQLPGVFKGAAILGLARMSSSVLALGISIWEYWRTVRPERIVRLTRRNGLVLRNRVRDTMAEFVEVMFSIPEMLVRSDERA